MNRLFLLLLLCFPTLLAAQSPAPVATSPQVDTSGARRALAFPIVREVKVKDTLSNQRFWLPYHNQEQLIKLRKAGFLVLKTRRLRATSELRGWEIICRDVLTIGAREGVRLLLLNNGPNPQNLPAGGG